jgi:peptide/nickel transport system permease protein
MTRISASTFRLRRNPTAIAGLVILGGLVVTALVGPYLVPYDPIRISLGASLVPPSQAHLMGTDYVGRDIFSRVIVATRLDLAMALAVVAFAAVVGSVVGLTAGYWPRRAGEVLMRVADIFMSFPELVLAMAVVALLGGGVFNTMIAIAFIAWPTYARLARAQVLQIKQELYVEGARAVGASDRRIIFNEILPVAVPSLLVQASVQVGQIIIVAAALGFLGLGARPPTPEWGLMASNGLPYLTSGEWWVSTFPGLAILVAALGFNLTGDGLRDVLDVTTRVR